MAEANEVEEVVEEAVETEVPEAEEVVEAEPDAVEQDEPADEPPVARSRANETVRAARERAQSAEREAQSARDEAARLRAEREQERMAAEQAARVRQEAEEKDLPYDERLYRFTQRSQEQMRNELQQTRLQMMDQADRTAFEVKAQSHPTYAKYQSKVEAKIKELRQAGNGGQLQRDVILKLLVGEDALAPKAKATVAKAKAAASGRVAAARGEAQVRGQAGRGDVGTTRQRIKSAEERIGVDTPI